MNLPKKFLGDGLAIAALFFIILVFLWRGVTMQGIFFAADETASDLLHFSYPYHEYNANEYLKHGKVALWNSYIGAGMPILGESQTGVFYPPAVLLFYFLPVPVAFNYLIIVNFILVAIGTYLFARSIKFNHFIAFYIAIVFCLSGYMVGHLRHVPLLSAAAFGPFMFFAVEKFFLRPNFLWAGILSLLISFSIFGGSLPTTYIILGLLIVYFSLRWWFLYGESKSKNWPILAIFLGSVVFAFALSAIQILPILELIPYSNRTAFNFSDFIPFSYKLKNLVFFVAPYLHGDPSRGTKSLDSLDIFWENIAYIGLLSLLLAFWGIFRGFKKQTVLIFVICLGLSFLLTLGQHTFFYKLLWDLLPGFDKIRISGRFLFFVDFFLAILAGFALKSLGEKLKGGYLFGVFTIVTLITLFDLFRFGFKFNTVISTDYFSPPESVKIISQDHDLFRVNSGDQTSFWNLAWQSAGGWRGDLTPYFWHKEILKEDLNSVFRLASPVSINAGGGHFAPEGPNRLALEIFSHNYFDTDSKVAQLLGMENVKYFIFERDFGVIRGMELISKINEDKPGFTTYLYKNNEWLPRAYFVSKYRVLKPEDILRDIFKSDFEPSREVFLEKDPKMVLSGSGGTVNIRLYSDNKVVLDAASDKGGFLVLSDTYYPGWKAYIDGKETEIFRANYAYRAVSVERGNHQIVFDYVPDSFRFGKMISIVSFAALFAVLLISKKYNAKVKI